MEKKYEYKILDKYDLIAGSDEAGRGCLAGPVVSASVLLKKPTESIHFLSRFNIEDSKKITSKKREYIVNSLTKEESFASFLHTLKYSWSNQYISVEVEGRSARFIEEYNILNASLDSMKSTYLSLKTSETLRSIWLIDGNKKPDLEFVVSDVEALVKGDSRSISIGLASVFAKVMRDKYMKHLDSLEPNYGFQKHKGYPTPLHKKAVKMHGPSIFHRRTFKGVSEFC